MRFHQDGAQPHDDEVFVFGSNLAGEHKAGTAKQALRYGARFGHGIGINGRTYAIPVQNHNVEPLSLEHIQPYIDRFVKFTNQYPQAKFFVTRIGCGINGYKDRDLASLFKGCGDNCNFPEQWEAYLRK